MRKIGKILFLVILVMLLICTLSFTVNAADYDGYENLDEIEASDGEESDTDEGSTGDNNSKNEIDEETTTETPTQTPTETDKNESEVETEEKEDIADKATTPHPQTGEYEKTMFAIIISILSIAIIFGYIKLKKYNY